MAKKHITVKNEGGLHLRVAAEIARLAQESGCTVLLTGEHCGKANGCSVMELLMLAASQGTALELSVTGDSEDEVAVRITDAFDGGSGI